MATRQRTRGRRRIRPIVPARRLSGGAQTAGATADATPRAAARGGAATVR